MKINRQWFKVESAVVAGWAGVALIWWGSNWKVALGFVLALSMHTWLLNRKH